ncbi:MAG: lipid II:glycine glycyltransferase FemX [Minisyncoccota bacterium]
MKQYQEFLQSEHWRTFQEVTGKKTHLFTFGTCYGHSIFHHVPAVGQYGYFPRGPILEIGSQLSDMEQWLRETLTYMMTHHIGWIRIEPDTRASLEMIRDSLEPLSEALKTHFSCVMAPHDVQPRAVLRMDLAPHEETLLSSMKPKTRYNIRLAKKHGVQIRMTRADNDLDIFCDLVEKTANRKHIAPHPREYYRNMLRTLPEDVCQIFVAEYQDTVVAANMVIIYEGTALYLHGGSEKRYREVMAPYLLQWQQIQYAKTRGCLYYDFGGVQMAPGVSAPTNQQKIMHQGNDWGGITAFKRGFSPKTVPTIYPGTYDIIIRPHVYVVYRILQRFQKIRRLLSSL